MAERVGFEPTRRLLPYAISSRACSATPASLHTVTLGRPDYATMAEMSGFEPTIPP